MSQTRRWRVCFFITANHDSTSIMSDMANKTYRKEVEDWRAELNTNIRKENGWLALAGLFWLKLGKNEFGSSAKCKVQLPARLPASIGVLEYNGRTVTLQANAGQVIDINGKPHNYAILEPDISENPSFVTLEDVRFIVIQRGNRTGIRVWDNRREERKTFPARTWFDIDENFRIPAVYTAYDHPKKVFFLGSWEKNQSFPLKVICHLNLTESATSLMRTRKMAEIFSSAFGIPPAGTKPTRPVATSLLTRKTATCSSTLIKPTALPAQSPTLQPVSLLQNKITSTFG
jgi:uncharacterized protein (DUF1684 family)